MAVFVPGLIAIIVFYVVITIIGIVAARRGNKTGKADELFLANRDFGMFVACLTIAASMVGGGYVNGTSEAMGRDGLVWSFAPIGYNIGMALAGIFIAPKCRRAGYTTILDPFQKKYGDRMGGLLFFPEFLGDVFWEGAILGALGTTLMIILDLNMILSVVVSTIVAVGYTLFGGLIAVAYTDIVQLVFIVVGLIVALPFAVTSPAVDLSRVQDSWRGEVQPEYIGIYIDLVFMTIGGGLPWQAWHQRMLACRTPELARNSTVIAAIMAILLAIPPAVIGAAGAATDWNQTSYDGDLPLSYTQWANILPMVLHYVCPPTVSILGIGAVSAAVMSSADSCVLATGSCFANNIYHKVIRPKASDRELIWVLRFAIIICGILGAVLAVTVGSVYGLFVLCGDLMFIVQTPQLICVLWVKFSNTYGSFVGFWLGFFLRIVAGEPLMKFTAWVRFPYYDEKHGQLFPYKTLSMIITFATIIVVSYLTDRLFRRNILPRKYDFFNCFPDLDGDKQSEDGHVEPLYEKTIKPDSENTENAKELEL